MFKFNIDLEKINELNGAKAEALFKYLKTTSKNKTQIVLKGTKEIDYWNCDIYECAVPASHLTSVKIPAEGDPNSDGTELYVAFTDQLLQQFVPGAIFTLQENSINVRRTLEKATAKIPYLQTVSQLQEQFAEYESLLRADATDAKTKLTVNNGSEIVNVLKEITSSPDATIFVTSDSITLQKDTVFFRTKNHETYQSTEENLFINMYLANKILSILDYSAKVEVAQTKNHIVVTGYDESDSEIVKNVSAIFEATNENPSDEDLESIMPTEDSAEVINVDMSEFLESLKKNQNMIASLCEKAAKTLEAAIYKNGNGLSLDFENGKVDINIGDCEEEDVDRSKFTVFATRIPKSTIESLMKDNQNLKIVFDNSEDTTVLFESGDYKILSGKLID